MDTLTNFCWLLAFGIGGVAAWLDWKGRVVPNNLWKLGLALLSPLLAWELFVAPLHFLIRLACAAGFFAVMWGLWRARGFGGGDSKGFAFFGLALSPVGYYDPMSAKFFPALDILVTSLLIAMLLRLVVRQKSFPLFTVSQGPLLLAPVAGGLAWWPIVGLLKFLVG